MKHKIILWAFLALLLVSMVFAEEYYYNTSDFTNKTSFAEIFTKANEYTFGWYGTGILIGFFIVTFVVARRLTIENKNAATVAFFVTSIIGILMIPLELVKLEAFILIVVCFVGALVTLLW